MKPDKLLFLVNPLSATATSLQTADTAPSLQELLVIFWSPFAHLQPVSLLPDFLPTFARLSSVPREQATPTDPGRP